MSLTFLIVSIIGALFTLNAFVAQRRTGPLTIPSFLAGWMTAELWAHHLFWQGGATVLFVWGGALGQGAGQLGLALTLLSWLGLVLLGASAKSAGPITEASLLAGLGEDYRDVVLPQASQRRAAAEPPPARPLNPFRFARPDVVVTKDIPYVPGGGERNTLDVYAPREGAKGAPVLLQIHGGGWTIGNKHEQALPLMQYLASLGWVCVAANYGLSPAVKFPQHLIDVKRAIGWIRDEIAGFGGDPEFLCATGGSAGGHLCSLVGLTANDAEYQPGFEQVDTSVQAVVPFYGVYDFTNANGLTPGRGMDGFLEGTVFEQSLASAPEAWRRASPQHRIHADAPPFFVIHGTNDSLAPIEEARHFAQTLTRVSSSPVVYAEIPGAQHAFEIFHGQRTSAVVQGVERFLSFVHAGYQAKRDRDSERSEASDSGRDQAQVQLQEQEQEQA